MFDFNQLVTRHIKRDYARSKTVGRYYPSEIGGCMRKVWYSYKYPQQLQPEGRTGGHADGLEYHIHVSHPFRHT